MTSALVGAIVFTDIVGFTQLTDEEGDDVAVALLERQDQLVRAALPTGGRIVKELGDGLLLWFHEAAGAVATCVELQGRFERESALGAPLWVRMGVHWGSPRARGNDIVGRDVNLAARVTDLAGPGEVLRTGAVVEAAGRVPGVCFEKLGPVFVRGIVDPIPLSRAVNER